VELVGKTVKTGKHVLRNDNFTVNPANLDIILLFNFLTLGVPDESFSKHASRALN
jgi:hypothetical protein